MAGVAGIGSDANWMGSHFNQANWYAFGRLAWNPDLSAQDIADEWIRQTFSNDPAVRGAGHADDDELAAEPGELHGAARAAST